ncbi:MAG: hypothetical protein IT326_03640 [Anaerolineae bacterium]|nr:hypothetical protein [Anaerolineae bacterium]
MSTRPHLTVLLLLIAASLACSAGEAINGGTPASGFSTATPGGSISISLLTPTATSDAPEQGALIVGPVGTATAAAQLAAAQTATALAPTPTLPGVFAPPARCPLPGTPTLPEQPPPFSRYSEIIARYLSAGGATTILEASLRSWGALADFAGLVRADRDFTGDGVPEVLVVAVDPQRIESFPPPGDLLIFGCDESAYRLLFQSGYSVARGVPLILSADDINGNLINDLVYTTQTCDDNQVCYQDVSILQWNLDLVNFASLVDQEIRAPFAQIVVSDVDDDRLSEVVVSSGTIAAIGAGPQRTATTVWKWDGTLYAIAEATQSPARYRIHVLYDADDAMRRASYGEAVDLYEDVIGDTALQSWQYPDEDSYLAAYAQFRIMLAEALRGRVEDAQARHDTFISGFASPPPAPDGSQSTAAPFGQMPGIEFARMADFWWADFAVNRDVGRACQVVIGYIRANPSAIEVLNTFGFANRTYSAIDVCPFGVTVP